MVVHPAKEVQLKKTSSASNLQINSARGVSRVQPARKRDNRIQSLYATAGRRDLTLDLSKVNKEIKTLKIKNGHSISDFNNLNKNKHSIILNNLKNGESGDFYPGTANCSDAKESRERPSVIGAQIIMQKFSSKEMPDNEFPNKQKQSRQPHTTMTTPGYHRSVQVISGPMQVSKVKQASIRSINAMKKSGSN